MSEKRTASQELTAVIPRDELPPPRLQNLVALDLDPEHPETKELLERAREALKTRPTHVPCPAGCRTCSCCYGTGSVTKEQADEWRLAQAEARGLLHAEAELRDADNSEDEGNTPNDAA